MLNQIYLTGKRESNELHKLATKLRLHVLNMTNRARSSHIGSNYSAVEILVVLFKKILRYDPKRPDWAARDRFILSKGHASAILYATLAECGFFPVEWLESFCQDGSNLQGHVSHKNVPGVEVSTGSLGHGLPMAVGMALAAKLDREAYRIFVVLSDGECDEGVIWESSLFASHHQLDNLIVVIDYNKIQSLGTVKDVIDLEPFADKWSAFGWAVKEVNGHDMRSIERVISEIPFQVGKPSCILAHTIKGKGVSFMENKLLWHYRSPQEKEYRMAMEELNKKP